ncbi:MAG: alpha/beta hydrolase [Verrucomicrobiota bacterium]
MKPLLLAALTAAALIAATPHAQAAPVKSIVLVHGAFADGSGWRGVYDILRQDGYTVSIVQNPTESLAGDVACAKWVIDGQKDKVILVGHSYGGAVITEAGNDPLVAGLVYVAAFVPDAGESVGMLSSKPAADASKPPILPARDGYLALDKSAFPAAFAADVDPALAAFMADSQTPWSLKAIGATITHPAWKQKPSWYIVASQDKMIPPSAERSMAKRANAHTTELAGSHAIFISQPKAVAAVIEDAANHADDETK